MDGLRLGVGGLVVLMCVACDHRPPPSMLPAGQSPGNIMRGQSLLSQYQCGSCHAIPNIPVARGTAGPPLKQFGKRSYIAGHIPNNAEMLAQWIVDPRSLIPNTSMPSMGVSPEDARDIAAYLHTLQ